MRDTRKPTFGAAHAAISRGWSLTVWLTLCNALSAFVLISLIAALLYLGLAKQLEYQNRQYLHDEIRAVKAIVATHGDLATLDKGVGEGHSGIEYVRHYTRLLDDAGRVVCETPGMKRILPAPGSSMTIRAVDITHRTSDGRLILSRVEGISGPPFGEAAVQVALDVSNVEGILIGYREKIGVALLVGFLLCFAASYAIARRGIRPLRRMTDVVRVITATNLEERVPVDGLPKELCALAADTNRMLERLQDSFNRLYRSATNLSHKMRTPLTIIRGEAEVALSRDRSVEELQDVIASSLEEVGRLSRLAETVLFLADAEIGKVRARVEPVDCREEAEQVLDYYLPVAEEKGIRLTCEGSALVVADAVLFRKLLGALVSNGVTYSRAGAEVTLRFRQREGHGAEVSVIDSGCGIPAEEMEKIFDRFYRIYGTRHMDPHGTGLGLPIAKAIMDLHNGDITIDSIPGEGTQVTAIFPSNAFATEKI